MLLRRYGVFLLGFSLSLLTVGCSKKAKVTGEGGAIIDFGADTQAQQPAQPVQQLAAFELTVGTTPETAPESTPPRVHQTCSISSDSALGTSEQCSVEIPEGALFYGNLILTMKADPKGPCHRISFRPYWYLASESAEFVPNWGEQPVNCFGEDPEDPTTKYSRLRDIPLECFGGPGKELVPNWPVNTGRYQFASESNEMTFRIPSANSKNYGSNRWTANDLPLDQRDEAFSVGSGDGYVQMGDYQFRCLDEFDELLYAFTLTVTDQNTSGQPSDTDNFRDWGDLF